MYTKLQEMREEEYNFILLNAGDFFQGTVWYSVFKYDPSKAYKRHLTVILCLVIRFGNMMGYDAMSFGNHEFDDGVEGIKPYVEAATYPIIAANMDDNGAIGNVRKTLSLH